MLAPPYLPTQLPSTAQRHTIHDHPAHSAGYSIAHAYQLARQAKGRTLVVMVAQAEEAQRLMEEALWFAPAMKAQLLPDWETLAYDAFSPHRDLIAARLSALYALMNQSCEVLFVPVTSVLTRCAPPDYLAARIFHFAQGDLLSVDKLKEQLVRANYHAVSQVVATGEFAVRGGIIDIYPVDYPHPLRLDLLDTTIESIRAFDPDTQRSIYPLQTVDLLPAHEFALNEESRQLFRSQWREKFEGDPSKQSIYRDIGQGTVPPGIEYYLPLFFEKTASLFDFFPADTHLILCGDLLTTLSHFWSETKTRYQFLCADSARPILPPTDIFLSQEDFFVQAKQFSSWQLSFAPTSALPDIAFNRRQEKPFSQLQEFIRTQAHTRVVLCADSTGRREVLQQLFHEHAIDTVTLDSFAQIESLEVTQTPLVAAPFFTQFALPPFHFITETELFAQHGRTRQLRQQARGKDLDYLLRDISEISEGDPLVHQQHGIGRYLGLVNLNLGQGEMEFLHLQYGGGTTLYVPVTELHQVSRYAGMEAEHAPLHVLGSGRWDKAKQKAREKIHDTAAQLLGLYAERALQKGYSFTFSEADYHAFCEGFPFNETADQTSAINAVMQDMLSDKAMDRLICGDVGFGKTEVAMRAAFIAVMSGKQVAILAPTTLLAEQHFNSFSQRFLEWPVKCAELSRFRTSKEVKNALEGLSNGTIDIVIGTHKLLSSGMNFARLGLVIVDEEHRFGTRQKEALKALCKNVDVLTMTATPIPRTLSMALDGLRDFSVIATAPEKRLSIKTFIREESESTIREACLRELKRGGQVFFLHNEVSTIENRRSELEKLLPEARIAVAHGQMAENNLERVMRDFVLQRSNVLLCTTIIETGIDVPNANTIVIHRADKFGLAQLHQLRGRVGRSHHQAYAYLLTPSLQGFTAQAEKRLSAIVQMEELGSGFYLAMHDLEIRGAGEILGDKQSGEMQEIGFEMYTDLLKRAISDLKRGVTPSFDQEPARIEINLHTPSLLPETYCPDVSHRLSFYKRLGVAADKEQLDALHEELIDRYGLLPEPAKNLLATHSLRLLAQFYGLSKIDASERVIMLEFGAVNRVEAQRLIALIQKDRHIKLQGNQKLRVEKNTSSIEARRLLIESLLKEIAVPLSAANGLN